MSAVRSFNPVWYNVDLQGIQFTDTDYLFVLSNTFPYLPATVWHDSSMTIPWTSPIQYLSNGTLPVDIFYDPNVVYRLEFRAGPTQANDLIYLVENYIPGGTGITPLPSSSLNSDNQISNGQFAYTNFQSPLVITTSGDYFIAPGWTLRLTGTGSTTINQVSIAGDQNIDGNPPYVLDFVNTGWTEAILFQYFNNTGGIWANEAINATITGISNSVGPLPITLSYIPSVGSPTVIATGSMTTSAYAIIGGGVALPASTNSATGNNSFVIFVITIPPIGDFRITNVQLLAGNSALITIDPLLIPYIQETIERQTDYLFHYYKNPLIIKPIPSHLVAWDFPLNPTQFNGSTIAAHATGANKSFYAWDQTIVFQSVDSSIAVSRGTGNSLTLSATLAGQAAIIQYALGSPATRMLGQKLAVNIAAKAGAGLSRVCTVSLYYTKDASLPNVASGTNNSLVATLDVHGKPATFNGNWIEVPRPGYKNATFTIEENPTADFNDYSFSGWDMEGSADVNLAIFFAIVVGFETLPINTAVFIESVGLYSGDIATRPAPQTFDEVLEECQFYYEKSYDYLTVPGTVTPLSEIQVPQGLVYNATVYNGFSTPFSVRYNTIKWTVPNISIYAASNGASGSMDYNIYANGSVNAGVVATVGSFWSVFQQGTKGFDFVPNSATTIISSTAVAGTVPASSEGRFHFVADARLGII